MSMDKNEYRPDSNLPAGGAGHALSSSGMKREAVLLMKVLNWGARFLFVMFAGFILYSVANIPESENLDIANYRADYQQAQTAYEVGYGWLTHMFRDGLGVSFEDFWMSVLLIQIALLLLAYNTLRWRGLVLCFPVLLSIDVTVIGTQIRFGLACSLLIWAVLLYANSHRVMALAAAAVACQLHNAAYLMAALFCVGAGQVFLIKKSRAVWLLGCGLYLGLLAGLALSIETVLSSGRYASYFGTEYFSGKSLGSIAYSLAVLSLLVAIFSLRPSKTPVEIVMHIALLVGVLVLSKYAIISGRMLVLSFFLEPLSIAKALEYKRSRKEYLLLGPLILASWSKVFYLS